MTSGKSKLDLFSTRIAWVVAATAMCVGTGNMWRFPRIAVMFGGSFMLLYLIWIFLMSVPIVIVEVYLGRLGRRGPGGSFKYIVGEKYTWMGNFLTMCNTGITFYYVVITGWTLYYFLYTALYGIPSDTMTFWNNLSGNFVIQYVCTLIVIWLVFAVIWFGIRASMEKVCLVIIPTLFAILIGLAIYANTLPGSDLGREYYWLPTVEGLANAETWLNAFTQIAWSSGPGWGIFLTMAAYMRLREDINTTSLSGVLGDTAAGWIAGFIVIPTLFALLPSYAEVLKVAGLGNIGLSFIVFPSLIATLPGGRIIAAFFFFAFFIAAFSSLIWMFEVPIRGFLADLGVERRKAALIFSIACSIAAIPSCYSTNYLWNQDMVWGVGLFIGSLFTLYVALFVLKPHKIVETTNRYSIFKLGKRWYSAFLWISFIVMISIFAWWIWQSATWYPETWWNPLEIYSPGTMVMQWAIVLAVFIAINKWFNKKLKPEYSTLAAIGKVVEEE